MYLIILCNFKYHKNKNLQNENYRTEFGAVHSFFTSKEINI